MKSSPGFSLAFVLLSFLNIHRMSAAITTYVSKFDQETIEEAYVSTGVVFVTDTFNSTPPLGYPAVGNFTSFNSTVTNIAYTSTGTPRIIANDQYGGNGEENYLGVTNGATVTATFQTPVEYFGIYISALDSNNRVQLYSGTTLLLDFSASTLTTLLPNNPTSTVTAIDGSVYNTIDYYGKPGTTLNTSEPYAYLSFFASGGTTISSVVMSETGAILETDNYSLNTTAPAVAGSLVLVPEPATAGMAVLSAGLLAGVFIRRRSERS